jgi:hypothetical protein
MSSVRYGANQRRRASLHDVVDRACSTREAGSVSASGWRRAKQDNYLQTGTPQCGACFAIIRANCGSRA